MDCHLKGNETHLYSFARNKSVAYSDVHVYLIKFQIPFYTPLVKPWNVKKFFERLESLWNYAREGAVFVLHTVAHSNVCTKYRVLRGILPTYPRARFVLDISHFYCTICPKRWFQNEFFFI